MSTTINVTQGGDELLNQAKQLQQAGRLAYGESRQREALVKDKDKQAAQSEEQGKGLAPLPYRRDPTAFTTGADFVPIAINWRGAVSTTQDSYTSGLDYRYEAYTNTLSVCTPNPVSLSIAGRTLVTIPQEVHISAFKYKVTNLPNGFLDQSGSGNIVSVQYRTGQPTYPLAPPPVLTVNRIAPTGFQPSIIVATKGRTLFAAVSLPPEQGTFNNRMSYYPWLNGGQPALTLIDDYPFDIAHSTALSPWRGEATVPYFSPAGQQVPTPYMFLRIQGNAVQKKTATLRHPVKFGDFYAANAFSDDPSKNMRETYRGEVRVVGQQARFLRMKDTRTGLYQDFPFGDLRSYISSATGVPVIAAPNELVIHTHQLPAFSNDAELAGYLGKCVDPNNAGGLYIGPSSEKAKQLPPSYFVSTGGKLDKTGPDTLTADSYFLVLL